MAKIPTLRARAKEPRRVQPKTSIRLQPTISSFTSKPSLSLRPERQILKKMDKIQGTLKKLSENVSKISNFVSFKIIILCILCIRLLFI